MHLELGGLMDWEAKVRDLRRIVNELELLAQQLEGRQRMLLGRSSDELKQFTHDLENLLNIEQQEQAAPDNLPDWLNLNPYD